MSALIAFVIHAMLTLMGTGADVNVAVIPPMPDYAPLLAETDPDFDEDAYEIERVAYAKYSDQFTALFNSYEIKRAKNGALMIRQGNSGSFRFAKKG